VTDGQMDDNHANSNKYGQLKSKNWKPAANLCNIQLLIRFAVQ